jgi:hypothetical protein
LLKVDPEGGLAILRLNLRLKFGLAEWVKEIFEKVKKSLITWIINTLKIKKSVESSFKICEIKRAKNSFSELSQIPL